MDKDIVRAEAKQRLGGVRAPTTKDELDEAFNSLIKRLQTIANLLTPKKKPSIGRDVPWWCAKVERAEADTKQRRQEYQANPS